MYREVSQDQSSHRCNKDKVPYQNWLGEIVRDHAEEYIERYNPPIDHIKVLRSMRLCRTPGLGGKVIQCKDCGHKHYVYLSCGNSKCSICQSHKREEWMQRLSDELYAVPYVHLVSTLPSELRLLAKYNDREIYNLMLRVTNQTIQYLCSQEANLGATVGVISVLHTYGSDMKYHVHVHSLVTFGGIDAEGKWRYPKRKKKLFTHTDFRNTFRDFFVLSVMKLELVVRPGHEEMLMSLQQKRWTYFVSEPTMTTAMIELYIARYINRIAITNSRLEYIKETEEVRILYNDYVNQKEGEVAPKAFRNMDTLLFLQQYLQHILPPYFQKVRRYGLHSYASKKKHQHLLQTKLKRNGQTIRLVFSIINHLLGLTSTTYECEKCGSTNYKIEQIQSDRKYIEQLIRKPKARAP